MNAPGFTAEASLYVAGRHYRSAAAGLEGLSSFHPCSVVVLRAARTEVRRSRSHLLPRPEMLGRLGRTGRLRP